MRTLFSVITHQGLHAPTRRVRRQVCRKSPQVQKCRTCYTYTRIVQCWYMCPHMMVNWHDIQWRLFRLRLYYILLKCEIDRYIYSFFFIAEINQSKHRDIRRNLRFFFFIIIFSKTTADFNQVWAERFGSCDVITARIRSKQDSIRSTRVEREYSVKVSVTNKHHSEISPIRVVFHQKKPPRNSEGKIIIVIIIGCNDHKKTLQDWVTDLPTYRLFT